MKKLASTLFLDRNSGLNGLMAFALLGAIALGCTCNKDFGSTSDPANSSNTTTASNTAPNASTDDDENGIPSNATLEAMVKETTADFADAIDSGDFTEIYDKSSPDFQTTYTKDQMADVFKDFVAKKKLILPSMNKAGGVKPEFSPNPRIRQEKNLDILVLSGKFPTKPIAVKFDYEYVKRSGEWKLLKLIVNL